MGKSHNSWFYMIEEMPVISKLTACLSLVFLITLSLNVGHSSLYRKSERTMLVETSYFP